MAQLTQRTASLGDLKEIWGLIRQVAPDIPFDLESEAGQENMLTEIMLCCTSGLSPVVIGEDKTVIGALLVRRDDFDWGFRNGDAVHVSYAAIGPSHRSQGLLPALVADIQERNVPVFVSVKGGDRLGLADELTKLGFAQESKAEGGWSEVYRWQPAAD